MTVYISGTFTQFIVGTITETNGQDISSTGFTMGLSTSSTIVPTVWSTPDSTAMGTTVAQRILKLRLSIALPAAAPPIPGTFYYAWAKITDNPEVIPELLGSFPTA